MLVAVAVIPVSAQAAVPAPPPPPVQPKPAEPDTPWAQAKRTGGQVEVVDARTEYDTSYADPVGTTTVKMSVVPIRVRKPSGWVPVDPTLVVQDDGSLAPRASIVDVRLSGGGSTKLATVQRGTGSLDIAAPMTLPKPAVSGSTATYAEVLPGVDLQVLVSGEGFSEVLVVKSAQAARNPALRTLTFPTTGRGLNVKRSPAGGLDVLDDLTGASVLESPAPSIWDSATEAPADPVSPPSARAGASPRATARGPQEGNRQAVMDVAVARGAVTITPDAAILSGSGTAYPVFIDPALGPKTAPKWAMLNKTYGTTSYYKWSDADEGMGYNNTAGTNVKRLYYEFDTSSLRVTGRVVRSATFSAFETFAYSCSSSSFEAWRSAPISSGTTWNSQPSWYSANTVRTLSGYGRDGCTPGGTWIDFNVTSHVATSVKDAAASTTIALRATSETSNAGWRRFRKDATLTVVYATPPNKPLQPQMLSPGTQCGGAVPAGDMPVMSVNATDPDGSANQLRVYFRIYNAGASTAFYTPQPTGWKANNSTHTLQMPNLAAGQYTWIAQAEDNEAPSLKGPWTTWCNFTVDNTIPTPPLIWFESGTWTVGQNVQFHFTGGGTGAVSYRYGVNTDAPTSSSIAANTSTSIPLTTFGPFTLRVWAYDASGLRSAAATWGGDGFLVQGADALDWWRMDEPSGTTSANVKSPGNPLYTNGTIARTTGFPAATGNAMVFNGSTAFGAGIGQGGPANGQNFSVSAWGMPAATTGRQVLLSQDANAFASFTIAMETLAGPPDDQGVAGPVLPRFVARLHTSTGTTAMSVVSSRPLQLAEWAHASLVVQRLESGALQMALYTTVAGDTQITEDSEVSTTSTPAYATSSASNAYVRVAAENKNFATASYWNGAVDEVVTAKGVFDEAQRQYWRVPPAP